MKPTKFVRFSEEYIARVERGEARGGVRQYLRECRQADGTYLVAQADLGFYLGARVVTDYQIVAELVDSKRVELAAA